MQKKRIFGKAVIFLSGMAFFAGVFFNGEVSAAGKRVLDHKKITLQAGKNKMLRLKNNKKAVKWSVTAGKKNITLRNKKRTSVKIIARKKGTARVQAKVSGKTYICRVTVTAKNEINKRNAADTAAVKKIIQNQKSLGAYEGIDNLNDTDRYFWDKKGRLTKINWTGCDLKETVSLAGLPALTELYCSGNQIQKLDISKNTALRILACGQNKLTALDVDRNTALEELYCYENQLTGLDISKNRELVTFSCYKNSIPDIDISRNTKLVNLDCNTNNLKKLDIASNTLLEVLHCHKNKLENLDLSSNGRMVELACSDNQIKELDVRGNVQLESLYCRGNQLKGLDISRNTRLIILSCKSNFITELDISQNVCMEVLECDNEVEVKK